MRNRLYLYLKARHSPLLSRLIAVEDFFFFIRARIRDTHVQEVASTMTLTTLISLVPMLAVSLAAFALFPSFAENRRELEDVIFHSFLPQQYSAQIVEYLRQFSEHASGLGVIGVLALLVTTLLLVNKLFVTVNAIFKVRRPRSVGQRALLYWALITLGPVFIAFSMTMSTQIIKAAALGVAPGHLTEILEAVRFFIQCFGFALLFKFVPNCHVPTKHALTGGLIVGVSLLVVRELFELYVSGGSLTNIYGAFVALPVLLLWLYWTWFIVFIGAAVTATMPLLATGRYVDHYRVGDHFLTAVGLLRELTIAKLRDHPAVSIRELCRSVDTYPQLAHDLLEKLSEAGYCAPIARMKGESDWALLGDPHRLTLEKASHVLLIDSRNALVHPRRRDERNVGYWYRLLMKSEGFHMPLSQLFSESQAAREEARALWMGTSSDSSEPSESEEAAEATDASVGSPASDDDLRPGA